MDQINTIASILAQNKTYKPPKTTERHVWTLVEEKAALALYKRNATPSESTALAEALDLKPSSMLMKIENIRFIDTGSGLANVSELTRRVFNGEL